MSRALPCLFVALVLASCAQSDKPIKRTIQLSAVLDSELGAYAEAYASEFGQRRAVEKLIPPTLERFIRTDRGFSKSRHLKSGGRTRPVGNPQPKNSV
jgi:hypothetical protein